MYMVIIFIINYYLLNGSTHCFSFLKYLMLTVSM